VHAQLQIEVFAKFPCPKFAANQTSNNGQFACLARIKQEQ
jgi:hypothetical protein